MLKQVSRKNAVHIMLFYAVGCNGCDIEIVNAAFSPFYDLEQYKVILTWNPREADILAVTGAVSKKIAPALKAVYEAIPEPKLVAAVGSCAINGGPFCNLGGDLGSSDQLLGGVSKVIPVDANIPGCPPRPEDIIQAVASVIPLLADKE